MTNPRCTPYTDLAADARAALERARQVLAAKATILDAFIVAAQNEHEAMLVKLSRLMPPIIAACDAVLPSLYPDADVAALDPWFRLGLVIGYLRALDSVPAAQPSVA